MPLYEYECEACGKRFEKIQKFSDAPLEVCELCGKGPIHKLLSSPAIQFKGTGWYITDYAKKGSAAAGETGASAKSESSDKPAEKKTETSSTKGESSSTTASKE